MNNTLREKTPSYIKVGILTVITTIIWIFLNVYRTLTIKPAPNLPAQVLASFSPELDTEKLGAIESRTFFEEEQVTSLFTATPTPTAEATINPTPIPEESPLPEETPLLEETPVEPTEPGEEIVP